MDAQHWGEGIYLGHTPESLKAQFDSTWTDSTLSRGKGVKPFLRWWHFARHRIGPDTANTAFRADAPWKATTMERAARMARTTSPPPIWTRATPTGLPLIGGAGRVNRVVIDPNDTSRWIACAPSGGVWHSLNSGHNWALLGSADWAGMGVSDVAFHPDDPQRILVATGDGDFGSAYSVGLLSTADGGDHWTETGLSFELSETATLQRVHRKSGAPEQILVASTDGLWLSEDDGLTFSRTLEGLFSDLLPHPQDSALWWAAERPGQLWRSVDGGRSWSASTGLPNPFVVSRYALAASAAAPHEVWAVAARSSTQGLHAVYHSVDSGASYVALDSLPNLLGWTVDGSDFGGQGFYDLTIAVDPANSDHVVVGGVNLWETVDGGAQWSCVGHWFGADQVPEVHADHHTVAFVPGTSDWVSAHDGGVSRLSGAEIEDLSEGLDIGQVYRFGISERRPDLLLSGWQDNGVNFLENGTQARLLGADGFHCLIQPDAPDTLIASEYFGRTFRSFDRGWSWEEWTGSNGEGVDERGDWNTPMAFAPQNPHRVFIAKHRLYWTEDGITWDQTAAIPGTELEVLALTAADSLVAIVARGANAFRTSDLASWTAFSGLPGLPVIDALLHSDSAGVCWLAFGGYDEANRIWRSTDAGETWSSVGAGLPALPVNTLARDKHSGDLYAGTDAGVYVCPAGQSEWTPYKEGLPEVLCTDLDIRYSTGELILSTYGRGLWKAPLYAPPARDGACLRILGATPPHCGAIPRVALEFRNAGTDTLVAATVVWNESDTLNYGFVLPPNRTAHLPWSDVLPGDVPWGTIFSARLLEAVGVEGGWSGGAMTGGEDEVSVNDLVFAQWGHRAGSGPVLFHTTADCRPLELAWAWSDSTGQIRSRRQHFLPEALTVDTLCMTHGQHTVAFHDQGGNGWSSPDCGMTGAFSIQSMQGGEVWPAEGAGLPDDFGEVATLEFHLPKPSLAGCTDYEACNFNPAAAEEDGSCDYACPDPTCPGDQDGDGIHGATDILAILSEFGCSGGCLRDITGDGAVTANDILALLALYGALCSE